MTVDVFDLDAFERHMAELNRLSEETERVLERMIADLDLGPGMEAIRREEEDERRRKAQEREERRSQWRGRGASKQQEASEMATVTRIVSDEARRILWQSIVEDDAISLPPGQLERKLYDEVNAVLESLGGKWHRGRRAHVFEDPYGDELAERFYTIAETGRFERPQDHGFYPTPGWLSDKMITAAEIEPHHRVLEPSAGQGAILLPLVRKLSSKAQAVVCELLPMNQKALKAQGFNVDASDFMTFECEPIFDRILANPPFARSQATIHVRKMIGLLRPGGRLVVIMPSSILQRQDKLHREVRQELIRNGRTEPLPDDTFHGVGTGVRTVMFTYDRPSDPSYVPFPGQAENSRSRAQEPSKDTEPTQAPGRRFQKMEARPLRFQKLAPRSLRRTT